MVRIALIHAVTVAIEPIQDVCQDMARRSVDEYPGRFTNPDRAESDALTERMTRRIADLGSTL